MKNFRSQAEKYWFTILENKMAKLNQNENSKLPDRPDAVLKLCFKLNE